MSSFFGASNTPGTSSFRPRSFSVASVAQAAIARDLEEAPTPDHDGNQDFTAEHNLIHPDINILSQHSLAGSYRRPSFVVAGNRSALLPFPDVQVRLSAGEQKEILEQERSLLQDNHIIPPDHALHHDDARRASLSVRNNNAHANENTPLFTPNLGINDQAEDEAVTNKWEDAVTAGIINTTWQREVKVLGGYCGPLMLTFLLQYSLTMASIFAVGRIGTAELGAVSLASMSANISGYAIYQGLSVSLDTLCAQAYGSGRPTLVGLQMQRMIFLLWLITIPIGVVWLLSGKILHLIVPEPEVAVLASQYLKILLLGAPGYACFEAGKRFVQAQGIFTASLYVLCVCAPLNAFLNWLFVWHFGWGFIGAPIAVAIIDNLLPVGLYIYVRFFSDYGMSCWGGFSMQAFRNWAPMIKLAIPGLAMIEAEILASEILTLMSSYFGVEYLAAQSILATVTALAFQVPFPLSVAASTRIANLIGATLADAARTSTKVAMSASVLVGFVNAMLLSVFRYQIPRLFTDEEEVILLVAKVLPICAGFQLFDSMAACSNGVLRGIGRQELGAYTQLFCYYAVGIPISIATSFGLGWHLYGLWTGNAIALASVTFIEAFVLSRVSWQGAVDAAKVRNELG